MPAPVGAFLCVHRVSVVQLGAPPAWFRFSRNDAVEMGARRPPWLRRLVAEGWTRRPPRVGPAHRSGRPAPATRRRRHPTATGRRSYGCRGQLHRSGLVELLFVVHPTSRAQVFSLKAVFLASFSSPYLRQPAASFKARASVVTAAVSQRNTRRPRVMGCTPALTRAVISCAVKSPSGPTHTATLAGRRFSRA